MDACSKGTFVEKTFDRKNPSDKWLSESPLLSVKIPCPQEGRAVKATSGAQQSLWNWQILGLRSSVLSNKRLSNKHLKKKLIRTNVRIRDTSPQNVYYRHYQPVTIKHHRNNPRHHRITPRTAHQKITTRASDQRVSIKRCSSAKYIYNHRTKLQMREDARVTARACISLISFANLRGAYMRADVNNYAPARSRHIIPMRVFIIRDWAFVYGGVTRGSQAARPIGWRGFCAYREVITLDTSQGIVVSLCFSVCLYSRATDLGKSNSNPCWPSSGWHRYGNFFTLAFARNQSIQANLLFNRGERTCKTPNQAVIILNIITFDKRGDSPNIMLP